MSLDIVMLGKYFNWGNFPIILIACGSFMALLGTFLYNTNSSINARLRHYESLAKAKDISDGIDILRAPISRPVLSFVLSIPLKNSGTPSPILGSVIPDTIDYEALFASLQREQDQNKAMLARLKHLGTTYGQVSFSHSDRVYELLEASGFIAYMGSQLLPHGVNLYFRKGDSTILSYKAYPQEDEFVTGYSVLNSRVYFRYDMTLHEEGADGDGRKAERGKYLDLVGLTPGIQFFRYMDANYYSMEMPALVNGFIVSFNSFNHGFYIPGESLKTWDSEVYSTNLVLTEELLRYPIKTDHKREQLLNKEITRIN